jgi:hypothetical protein
MVANMNCVPVPNFAIPYMTCARIFKLLRDQGIESMESIPYNLSFLYAVMEQETSQQCPQNVIYIRVGMAQFTVWPRKNMCYIFHSWLLLNSRNRIPRPLTRQKN